MDKNNLRKIKKMQEELYRRISELFCLVDTVLEAQQECSLCKNKAHDEYDESDIPF